MTPAEDAIVPVKPERPVPGRVRLWRVDLDRYGSDAHHALRSLAGEELGRDGGSMVIERGPFGQPLVAGAHVSLSHSEDVALIGIADVPVGVDLELVRAVPEREGIAEEQF